MKTLATILSLLSTTVYAAEIKYIKFVCQDAASVLDVITSEDLVIGISNLPSNCDWILHNAEILETYEILDVNNQYVRVAKVKIENTIGYSAGIIDLTS